MTYTTTTELLHVTAHFLKAGKYPYLTSECYPDFYWTPDGADTELAQWQDGENGDMLVDCIAFYLRPIELGATDDIEQPSGLLSLFLLQLDSFDLFHEDADAFKEHATRLRHPDLPVVSFLLTYECGLGMFDADGISDGDFRWRLNGPLEIPIKEG